MGWRSKIFTICRGTLWDLEISLVPSGFGGVSLHQMLRGLEDHCCPELHDPRRRLWGRRELELFVHPCSQEHHDPCQNWRGGGRETLQLWSLLAGDPAQRACLQPSGAMKGDGQSVASQSRFWGRWGLSAPWLEEEYRSLSPSERH